VKSIVEHYGDAVIVFVAIIALIGIVVPIITGAVSTEFSDLITNFFDTANAYLPTAP